MNRFDFYKELYFREIDRRAALSNDVNIPLGIITLMGTVLGVFLTGFDFGVNHIVSALFILPVSTGSVALMIAIWRLMQSYQMLKASPYRETFFATELERFRNSLIDYYTTQSGSEEKAETLTTEDLERFVINELASSIRDNSQINDRRVAQLQRSKRLIVLAIAAYLLALLPFMFNFYTKPEKSLRLKVIEPVTINCDSVRAQLQTSISMSSKQVDKSTDSIKERGYPVPPPPPRYIQEGKVPPTEKERGYLLPKKEN